MTQDEFSLLFHRAQVNLVAFKMLYEPEAFVAMQRMVEMAVAEEREACAKVCEAERILGIDDERAYYGELMADAIRARGARMTQDEIADIYQKANGWSPRAYPNTMAELEAFAKLVAEVEREACAKLFDDRNTGTGFYEPHEPAEIIRARGQE